MSRSPGKNTDKQESPPAWTQEAYRPPCSEYSFCCPTRGGVRVPPQGGSGYPPRGGSGSPPGGTWPGSPPGGVPDPGTPPPGGGGYLTRPPRGLGTPPPGGYLTRVPPPGGGTWTPPGVDRQTKWNYYLPVVLRTRVVMNMSNKRLTSVDNGAYIIALHLDKHTIVTQRFTETFCVVWQCI